MPELTPKERLQPSLLDRLTEGAPRVFSQTQWLEMVKRDLSWLLNCGRLESVQDLEDYPEVRHSVLNYGMEELSGVTLKRLTPAQLEQGIRQTILRFEPRIIASTLRVTVTLEADRMDTQAVSLAIEGLLWAMPLPLSLYLKADIDWDTGQVWNLRF